MWQLLEILNVFNVSNLKHLSWKKKNKKNKSFKILEYRFIVESTKIENAPFPHKSEMSDTNVKKNRMRSTKSYRTEFCQYQFIFFLKKVQYKNFL